VQLNSQTFLASIIQSRLAKACRLLGWIDRCRGTQLPLLLLSMYDRSRSALAHDWCRDRGLRGSRKVFRRIL